LLVAVLAGAATALALGVYGNVHDPTGRSLVTTFFSATINAKVWLATGAMALGLFQLVTALRMYGKLGVGAAPAWMGKAHRLSGTAAILLTLPVSYHCLWALGFTSDAGARVLIHSLVGCLFYGAFISKVVIVRHDRLPGWVLPWAGGVVFTSLVALWLTSSFWFFTTVEFPGF
jgi:hypothetical protein